MSLVSISRPGGLGSGIQPPPPASAPVAAPAAPALPSQQDLIKDLLDEERFKTRQKEEEDRLKERRKSNIQEGQDFIKDFSLGRISGTPLQAENDKLRTLLEGRLGGLSSGEGAALREQAFGGLNRQREEGLRALRGQQGTQGVRGPAAVAQQQEIFSQAANRGSDLEQRLLLANLDIQRQAAADFSGEVGRQQGTALGIDQFNIGQGDRETGIKAAFPLQFANLGLQEGAAATGAITGRDALLAALFPAMFGQGSPTQGAPQGIPTIGPAVGSTGQDPIVSILSGAATGKNPDTTVRSPSIKGKPISMETLQEQLRGGGFNI